MKLNYQQKLFVKHNFNNFSSFKFLKIKKSSFLPFPRRHLSSTSISNLHSFQNLFATTHIMNHLHNIQLQCKPVPSQHPKIKQHLDAVAKITHIYLNVLVSLLKFHISIFRNNKTSTMLFMTSTSSRNFVAQSSSACSTRFSFTATSVNFKNL